MKRKVSCWSSSCGWKKKTAVPLRPMTSQVAHLPALNQSLLIWATRQLDYPMVRLLCNGCFVWGGFGLVAGLGFPWLGLVALLCLLLPVLLCAALVWCPCVLGVTLGQIDPRPFDCCYMYMYTSGSGPTKPFFLGKSYGLLKVINID